MATKKEKEEFDRICKCGHRYGNHSFFDNRCLADTTCKCKWFKLADKEFAKELGGEE